MITYYQTTLPLKHNMDYWRQLTKVIIVKFVSGNDMLPGSTKLLSWQMLA